VAEGIVIIAIAASAIALSLVSTLAEVVARLAGFRFGPMKWFLHGLGFLVMLPFVLALMILTFGLAKETWFAGGFLLLAALVSFIGGGIDLVRGLVAHDRHAFARPWEESR
jgi:hypothetical protein